MFQSVTAVVKDGEPTAVFELGRRFLLGLLLLTSWLPIYLYNSTNKEALESIQMEEEIKDSVIERSQKILNWFLTVKLLIVVIRLV